MDFIKENERIYANDKDGKLIAEIRFSLKKGIAVITHTFVDESLRGQGIASQLVRLAVEQIRKNGVPVAATCSYAQLWLQRHPEHQPVNPSSHH
ncbi:MAG: N-acetyltransferase [Opitutales bacterium]|nr:N-acetyltransferase [Opitutales bacterium]